MRRHATRLMDAIAGLLRDDRSLWWQLLLCAVSVVVATLLRLLVDPILPPGYPFLTYFPAVLLVALFGSLWIGTVTAILSGLIAWIFFLPPVGGLSFDPPTLGALAFYALVVATELFFIGMTAHSLRQLRAALRRADDLARSRDLMFSELQHRVSNNLATVGALLRMQATQLSSQDARQALLEATQRLNTVARIQRSLHAPNMQEVALRPFLDQLARDTVNSLASPRAVTLTVSVQDFSLSPDRAIPFGLVASEMLMNALEHGRPATGEALLHVNLALCEEADHGPHAVLTIEDNGPGLPAGVDPDASSSLGLTIARQFARQLDGRLTLAPSPSGTGTQARLVIPVRP